MPTGQCVARNKESLCRFSSACEVGREVEPKRTGKRKAEEARNSSSTGNERGNRKSAREVGDQINRWRSPQPGTRSTRLLAERERNQRGTTTTTTKKKDEEKLKRNQRDLLDFIV